MFCVPVMMIVLMMVTVAKCSQYFELDTSDAGSDDGAGYGRPTSAVTAAAASHP